MEEVGNTAMLLPAIESVTMSVLAVVVTEEIVSGGVGMTILSNKVSIRELIEPDAVVIGMLISVGESRGMLLVVKGGVWATTAGLVLGADVTIGDVGMGVALLMKEVRFTASMLSGVVDILGLGVGNAVVSAEAKLVVVAGEGIIVGLITDEIV